MVWRKAVLVLVLALSVALAGKVIQQTFPLTNSSAQLVAKADPKAIQEASELIPTLLDDDAEIREQAFKELRAMDVSASLSALVQALEDEDWQIQVVAAYTLGRFGTEAKPVIPELTSKIGDENADVRFAVAQSLGNIGSEGVTPALIEALQDQDENVRFAAAEALVILGPDAEAAIPVLMKTLRDGNWFVRSRAANAFVHLAPQSSSLTSKLIDAALNNPLEESPWFGGGTEYHLQRQQKIPAVLAFDALAEIGVEAAPPLIDSLASDDILAEVPNPTLALVQMGNATDSDEIVALLIQALQHPDWTIRKNASLALGSIGSKTAVPALVQMAPSRWGQDPAIALGQIGFRVILDKKRVPFAYEEEEEEIESSIPPLADALQNEDWQVGAMAAAALGLTSESAIPLLHRSLQDEDWRVRSTSVTALGMLYSDKTLPSLITASYDKDWQVRRNVSYAIQNLPYDARQSDQITPILTRLLNDSNEDVRLGAAIALGASSDDTVPVLINALQNSQDSAERIDALRSLDQGDSEDAAMATIQALQDENVVIRDQVVFELSFSLDDYSKPLKAAAISALINSLKDESAEVRRSAAFGLGEVGEFAVPELIEASQDQDPSVRRSAIAALGEIGTEPAVSVIYAALQDEDEDVRTSAARALGDSGIQLAISNLQNEDWQIRRNSIEKISLIGVNASNLPEPAVQALIQALQDPDSNVRTSAASALVTFSSNGGEELDSDIDKALQTAIPNLIDSLENGDALARLDAIFVLGGIGNAAETAIPYIQSKLKDENWLVRYAAAVTLLKLNPKDESAVPVLAEIFANTDYAQMIDIDSCCTDHYELEALANIGSDQAIAALINSLQISDEKLRYTYYLGPDSEDLPLTATTLIGIGSKAIPALILGLENENIRFITAKILGQIGAESVPSLLEVLQREPSTGSALNEILSNKDIDIRRSVVYALGQIGKKDLESETTVTELLMEVMNDTSEHLDVRWMATASLTEMEQPVEQFFVQNNLRKPVNDICIETRYIDGFLYSEFDLYAARCLHALGGRGAGWAQIYQQVRVLLSGNVSGSTPSSQPTPSPSN